MGVVMAGDIAVPVVLNHPCGDPVCTTVGAMIRIAADGVMLLFILGFAACSAGGPVIRAVMLQIGAARVVHLLQRDTGCITTGTDARIGAIAPMRLCVNQFTAVGTIFAAQRAADRTTDGIRMPDGREGNIAALAHPAVVIFAITLMRFGPEMILAAAGTIPPVPGIIVTDFGIGFIRMNDIACGDHHIIFLAEGADSGRVAIAPMLIVVVKILAAVSADDPVLGSAVLDQPVVVAPDTIDFHAGGAAGQAGIRCVAGSKIVGAAIIGRSLVALRADPLMPSHAIHDGIHVNVTGRAIRGPFGHACADSFALIRPGAAQHQQREQQRKNDHPCFLHWIHSLLVLEQAD